jgi:hypothetical protein
MFLDAFLISLPDIHPVQLPQTEPKNGWPLLARF